MNVDTGEQLFRAITERPDDDTPRLIYADWLEENRDADRAHRIRDQIALANASYDDLARSTRDYWEWLAFVDNAYPPQPIDGLPLQEPVRFWRGFPARFTCAGMTEFRKFDKEMFGVAPSVYLEFPFPTNPGEKWSQCEYLGRIRGFYIGDTETSQWPYSVAYDLLSARKLHNLQLLSVSRSTNYAMDWSELILELRHLDKLEVLRLQECELDTQSANHLANLTHRSNLRVLSLGGNQLMDCDLAMLATNPGFRNLTELHLGHQHTHGPFNVVGLDGLRAILTSEYLRNLRVLDLSDTALSEEAIEILAESPSLESLRYLNLSTNAVSARSIEALASSPHSKNLRRLNLEGNDIGDLAVKALLDSPRFEELVELNLTLEWLNPKTMAAVNERFGLK
ncbi:MAG: TIGR02996 domain-containing protein [Gemmataceae bacterium]